MHSLLPFRFASNASLRAFSSFPGRPKFFSPAAARSSGAFPLSTKSMSIPAAAVPSNAIESASSTPADGGERDVVVQYVVLRRDLIDTWPLGSVVTQGCHACVAAVWSHRHHQDVALYCSEENIDSMHKVTLEVKGETQLKNLSEKLEAGGIDHKLWIEQPENFPTCLATRPYPKSQVASYFKKLKLSK